MDDRETAKPTVTHPISLANLLRPIGFCNLLFPGQPIYFLASSYIARPVVVDGRVARAAKNVAPDQLVHYWSSLGHAMEFHVVVGAGGPRYREEHVFPSIRV
jgi:hypothetical protein